MLNLKIIIASTRPGRVGLPVGQWFYEQAKQHPAFTVDLIDLAEVNLPFVDEPNHPRFRTYTKEHTKAWSARIDPGDAYVFVMPEYNYGYPATLKNAIDFLYQEWQEKPVGFVTYGGVSAGTRSMQAMKSVVSALNMMAVTEAVNIPFVAQHLDAEKKVFLAQDVHNKPANLMLDKMAMWGETLKQMRAAKGGKK